LQQTYPRHVEKVKAIPLPPCRRQGEKKVYSSYSFFTSALGDRSVSRSGSALPPEKDPGTDWMGGWVGLRRGLNTDVTGKKSFAFTGDRTPVVQSVVVAKLSDEYNI
jgi:hypothetical protein